MCILLVILSIIPILSGYAIYLAVAAIVTGASPLLQLALGVGGGLALFLGVRWLWHYLVQRRNHRNFSD